jgi:hypothetical protein
MPRPAFGLPGPSDVSDPAAIIVLAMPSRRKKLLAIAWLAIWALIFVFASALPAWLAIGLAVVTFAAFLLFSRDRSACLELGANADCAAVPSGRHDASGSPRSR